ncbi:putative WD repeat-containing protein [Porphyridium purpureum]|uniref:Putative WD repeat-containing protein n=1 Tax=Porphyridium purpureum TaxID=35688 RepID=A0A5J4YFX5_PORPP|nr:putative WD repeat-containing protein [Porphyridium purpureum]KAA8492310.1 putative WD repeat-containing protein [Porphyridium purpureum]|eukprot:POR3212..scf250_33
MFRHFGSADDAGSWFGAWGKPDTSSGTARGTRHGMGMTARRTVGLRHVLRTQGRVSGMAVSGDGNTLVAGSWEDRRCRVFDPRVGRLRLELADAQDWVWLVAVSECGAFCASAADDVTVRLYSSRSGRLLHHVTNPANYITFLRLHALAWSLPDTQRQRTASTGMDDAEMPASGMYAVLAICSSDGTVAFIDTYGRCPLLLAAHSAPVLHCSQSPDGSLLATSSKDKTIALWNISSAQAAGKNGAGSLVHRLVGHGLEVVRVVFSPDGRWLASASKDRRVIVWDIISGDVKCVLDGHRDQVVDIAWAGRTNVLVSVSKDHTARMWNTDDGSLCHVLPHLNRVDALCVHPNGNLVATGSHDRCIRIWETHSGQLLQILHTHEDLVSALTWLPPDGSGLVSGSADRTVIVWTAVNLSLRNLISVSLEDILAEKSTSLSEVLRVAEVAMITRASDVFAYACYTLATLLYGRSGAHKEKGKGNGLVRIENLPHDVRRAVSLWKNAIFTK